MGQKPFTYNITLYVIEKSVFLRAHQTLLCNYQIHSNIMAF